MRTRFAVLAMAAALAAPLASADPAEVRIQVDAAAVGAPISPYVYGQFIEHLGRCIYGGLWAEMLEDRKFFYPATGEAPAWEMYKPGEASWEGEGAPYELLVRSAWLVVGGKDAVTMLREHPYVGEHSPKITLPGGGHAAGLVQERLGLQAGREYVGRIVLAGDASAGPSEVSLAWGGGGTDRVYRDAGQGLQHARSALPLPRDHGQRPARDRLARRRASAPDRRIRRG